MGGKARSQSSTPGGARIRTRTQSPQRVAKVQDVLAQTWAHAECELDHDNPYQLLCATVLSAQSTDRQINKVTPALFERYPDAHALAEADPGELEDMIRSTGFYRLKAKRLREMAQLLVERHGGEVPGNMRQLVALPGVARKTANVVLGVAFDIAAGIVVDTHVQRVSRRLGLTEQRDPDKIERDLMELVPKRRWISVSHELIWHGRRVCDARKPDCENCSLMPLCPSALSAQATGAKGQSKSGERR